MEGIFDFLGKVPQNVWDFLPTLGAPGWIGGGVKVLIGLFGLTAISRIVPDKWLYVPITQFFDKAGLAVGVVCFSIGKAVTTTGRKLLGKRRWEKIEEQIIEKAIGLFFRAVFDGVSLFVQRIRNGLIDGLNMDDPGVGKLKAP